MAYCMEQDPDALLDIVLNMDSNSSDGLLGASLQDTRTVDSEHIPVYTELTNSVFDDIEPAPHLTDLNGLIDIDSLPQVPFSPDAASLPHSGSGASPSLEWPSGTYAGSPTVHHRPASEGQGVTPRILPAPQSFQTSDFNANTHATVPNIQFINVQNPDPSHRRQHPQPAGSSPPAKPKTRRRVTTASQRKAANVRERRRMFNLNEAFDVLRKSVPTFAYEKRLSRIETLRLAMLYITFMGDVLSGKRSGDGNLQKLLESGKFAGLTNSNPGPRQGSTVLNSAASRMNRKPDGTTGATEES